jgi:hypothetical protein
MSMLAEATSKPAPALAVSTARLKELRAIFKRQIPYGRLTNAQKLLLSRCVVLTARAEAAALDPNATHDDVVRLDRLASQLRREWTRVAEARQAAHEHQPNLQELLNG